MSSEKLGVSADQANIFNFGHSYYEQLSGFYQLQDADIAPSPKLIKFNDDLACSLGLDVQSLDQNQLAEFFSGAVGIPGSKPLAQAYAGHQFGHYNPQLGDGRALLLGEVIDTNGQRQDVQLKGSGRTAYSRNGDGKAALGPVLREYLISEAMHALGVPTTRALAAVVTGEEVWRNMPEKGAVLTRVAASHIRVGTFQYFSAKGDKSAVKRIADYVIERHYPEAAKSESPYLDLLKMICEQQALLVAKWQSIGFVHGVMNTDNTTVSGETIDFGPCAFMDIYDPQTVFSSIDSEGRYAYCNQPYIAQWNLARLGETLLPLISENEETAVQLATEVLKNFMLLYQDLWLKTMGNKIGIEHPSESDKALVDALLQLLDEHGLDFTLSFRALTKMVQGEPIELLERLPESEDWDLWKKRWEQRLQRESNSQEERLRLMNRCNPIYIPRNHKVEEALFAAENHDDFEPFERLHQILSNPFSFQSNCEEFERPAPEGWGPYRTFCGT